MRTIVAALLMIMATAANSYEIMSYGRGVATIGTSAVFFDKVYHEVENGEFNFWFRDDAFTIIMRGNRDRQTDLNTLVSVIDSVSQGAISDYKTFAEHDGSGKCITKISDTGSKIFRISCTGMFNGDRYTVEFTGSGNVYKMR